MTEGTLAGPRVVDDRVAAAGRVTFVD